MSAIADLAQDYASALRRREAAEKHLEECRLEANEAQNAFSRAADNAVALRNEAEAMWTKLRDEYHRERTPGVTQ